MPKVKHVKPLESDLVREFKQAVRKRPADVAWLISYGSLARSMGLTYLEALSAVKPHIRKLRGNIRHIWIDQGLRTGYDQVELLA